MNKSILKMKGYIILYLQLSYSDISRWNEKYRKLSPCLSKKINSINTWAMQKRKSWLSFFLKFSIGIFRIFQIFNDPRRPWKKQQHVVMINPFQAARKITDFLLRHTYTVFDISFCRSLNVYLSLIQFLSRTVLKFFLSTEGWHRNGNARNRINISSAWVVANPKLLGYYACFT